MMPRRPYFLWTPVGGLLGAALVASAFGGDGYEMTRTTTNGGGAMHASGGEYDLRGTIGEPASGPQAGGPYELNVGFWFPISPGDCGEDGDVDLIDYLGFPECLSGPGAAAPGGCTCFDVDGSGEVDLVDVAGWQLAFTGP